MLSRINPRTGRFRVRNRSVVNLFQVVLHDVGAGLVNTGVICDFYRHLESDLRETKPPSVTLERLTGHQFQGHRYGCFCRWFHRLILSLADTRDRPSRERGGRLAGRQDA